MPDPIVNPPVVGQTNTTITNDGSFTYDEAGERKTLTREGVLERMKKLEKAEADLAAATASLATEKQFSADIKVFQTDRAAFDRVSGVMHADWTAEQRETAWRAIQARNGQGGNQGNQGRQAPAQDDNDAPELTGPIDESLLPPSVQLLLSKMKEKFGSVEEAINAMGESSNTTEQAKDTQSIARIDQLIAGHPKLRKFSQNKEGRRVLAEGIYASIKGVIKRGTPWDQAVAKGMTDKIRELQGIGALDEAKAPELSLYDRVRGAVPASNGAWGSGLDPAPDSRPEPKLDGITNPGSISKFTRDMRRYMEVVD